MSCLLQFKARLPITPAEQHAFAAEVRAAELRWRKVAPLPLRDRFEIRLRMCWWMAKRAVRRVVSR